MLEQSCTHMCTYLLTAIQPQYPATIPPHTVDKYNHHHHHHSGSCNEHTSKLCARAARKQTTTSGTATTYYHHHTVQVTMHTFSICAIALEKTPPPPPPHSASYNIAATTTCASKVSALVGHRKRPPVQVTVAPGQHTHHSHHHMCQKVNALNG